MDLKFRALYLERVLTAITGLTDAAIATEYLAGHAHHNFSRGTKRHFMNEVKAIF
jgi:hypothetical protein